MNILIAFMIVYVAYAIGDVLAGKTKGVFSSVLFCFFFYLIGFWTFLPKTFFADSGLTAVAVPLLYLLMVNMGTTIDCRDFIRQWKTVIIAFCVGLALCVCPVLLAPIFIDKLYAYVAGPVLSGAIPAALIMQAAAEKISRTDLAVFATVILAIQGFVGIPIASICLKREAKVLVKRFRSGREAANAGKTKTEMVKAEKSSGFQLIPKLPDKYLTNYMIIAKLSIVAVLAEFTSKVITQGKISSMITCLLLGIIFKELGFLEASSMNNAQGLAFVYSVPTLNCFVGLANSTPEMMLQQIAPMLITVVLGVIGMILVAAVLSKIFKWSVFMALAVGSSALFGFPITLILSNEIAQNVGETADEVEYIRQDIQPKMVIAGIVTVTLASVFFAGVLSNFIK